MIFFPLMLTKRIKDYTVFFNILNLKQTCRLQESTLKRVILNKCCSRIKSFSQKKSKTKLKKKKTLQITIEFPHVEIKHCLFSPRLFVLLLVLIPKNLNILAFGDQM